jgi:hypothetical protein
MVAFLWWHLPLPWHVQRVAGMSAITIQQMTDRVATLMETRLGARGPDLAARVAKVGYALPRPVRHATRRLAQAAVDAQNPRLLLQIDEAQVAADYDTAMRHLGGLRGGGRLRAMLTSAGGAALVSAVILGALTVWGLMHAA